MLSIVSKIFYLANFTNKTMTASVYGHNFAVKFQRPKLENCIDLFCSFILFINFKMGIGSLSISHLKLSMF